jgi:hypothetical protein
MVFSSLISVVFDHKALGFFGEIEMPTSFTARCWQQRLSAQGSSQAITDVLSLSGGTNRICGEMMCAGSGRL